MWSNLHTLDQSRANQAPGFVAEVFDHGFGADQDIGVDAMTCKLSPAPGRQSQQIVSRRTIGYNDQKVEVTVGIS